MRPILTFIIGLCFILLACEPGLAAEHNSVRSLHWAQTLAWPLFGFLATGGYFLWAWQRVRRASGVIVLSFHPPAGLTPAQARYITRQGCYDDKTFWSAALSLAFKERLRITAEDSSYRLDPQGGAASSLGAEETALIEEIGAEALELKRDNRRRIAQALGSVKAALDQLYKFTAVMAKAGALPRWYGGMAEQAFESWQNM